MERARGAELEDLLAHSDWLTRLARRLTGAADADDAVQETWLAAHRSPPDPDRPPRPWLTGVLRNLVRARWQSDGRRRRREQAQALLAPDREAAVDTLHERIEMQRLVAQRVMALDEPLRTVVLLRYFEGHDSTRIAEILELPAGTVRWRLKTAIDRLRAEMDARFEGDRRAWMLVLAPGSPAVWPLLGTVVTASLALALGAGLGLGMGAWSGKNRPATADQSAGVKSESLPLRSTARDRPDVPRLHATAPVDAIAGIVLAKGEPEDDAVVVASPIDGTEPDRWPAAPPPRSHSADGGRFLLTSLPSGRYRLTASGHTGGTARSGEIDLAAGRSIEGVVLDLAGAAAGLAGRVLDPAGIGIPRARVRARQQAPTPLVFETESGCLGRYRLDLDAGLYGFEVEAEGYAPVQFSFLVHTPVQRQLRLSPAGTQATTRMEAP
jgi:RNA polymerase sigma factor (sigma-70 family)